MQHVRPDPEAVPTSGKKVNSITFKNTRCGIPVIAIAIVLLLFPIQATKASFLNDIIEFITNFAISKRLDALTSEEKLYWQEAKRIRDHAFDEYSTSPDIRDSEKNLHPSIYLKRVANDFELIPRYALQGFENLNPPALFTEYHKQSLSLWKSLSSLGTGFAIMFRAVAGRPTASFQREFDERDRIWQSAVNTHISAVNTELDKINKILKRRKENGDSQTLNINILKNFTVTYQPYFVPIQIQISSNGEIILSTAKKSIPTPIGIFSVGAELVVQARRTLVIVYGGKKYVYELGSEPFVFDVSEYEGSVFIEYDGNGNATIRLG